MEKTTISKEEALNTLQKIRSDIVGEKNTLKKRRKCVTHLQTYIVVITLLWFINWYSLNSSGNYGGHPVWWAIYPTLGWGVAILLHFLRNR